MGLTTSVTDYVFDGTSAPYVSTAQTNPVNHYGRTKRDGENAVLDVKDAKVVVLRVPVLCVPFVCPSSPFPRPIAIPWWNRADPDCRRYGPAPKNTDSAVNLLLDVVQDQSGKEYKMDHYATRFPTAVDDIGAFLVRLTSASFLPSDENAVRLWTSTIQRCRRTTRSRSRAYCTSVRTRRSQSTRCAASSRASSACRMRTSCPMRPSRRRAPSARRCAAELTGAGRESRRLTGRAEHAAEHEGDGGAAWRQSWVRQIRGVVDGALGQEVNAGVGAALTGDSFNSVCWPPHRCMQSVCC
jgi:hypothetical protein